ncbi:MAG: L,D-transpeptidase family protein [Gammaproteobacteria bacterium]|nr:L,D-transpeptidase family protein [Gammaproteobacteria bacterium]
MRLFRLIPGILFVLAGSLSPVAGAESFTVFDDDTDLVGEFRTAHAEHQDTLLDIARSHGLGYTEIRLANAGVDTWLPGEGQQVVLPKRFILPPTPREGLVLNIPEMRLYYYPARRKNAPRTVQTYPLGVGREGWSTPYVTTRITSKVARPSWYPPESIREEHAADGDPLPRVVPAGPDNPLGDYAMRLALPSYLIHGTNRPWGVGMRVSHGCIRLYPEDIETLFNQVEVGTPVRIINQPYKVGHKGGIIYLEAHPHLEEDAEEFKNAFTQIVNMVQERTGADADNYDIDWELARLVMKEARGVPVAIGMELPRLQQAAAVIMENDPLAGMQLQLDGPGAFSELERR